MISGVRRPRPTSCVHDLISMQARRTPNAVAVEHGDERVSYATLERTASIMSDLLEDAGVRRGQLVPICCAATIDSLAAILAILKCGAAYVPLDVSYPEIRKQSIAEQVKAELAIVDVYAACSPAVRNLSLTTLVDEARRRDTWRERDPGRLDSLAYVIFTSGSTGVPKGVLTHHLGVANLVLAMVSLWPIEAGNRVLQFASLGFDASVPEWAGPLIVGGTVVLKPTAQLLLGGDLVRFVGEKHVNLIKMPASALRAVPLVELPTIKVIITAGEACTPDLARCWAAKYRFFNCYGPTEASIGTTMARLDADCEMVTIGWPNPNVEVIVLDEQLRPLPSGEAGELFVAGMGVGWGYLGHAKLTAERFLPNLYGAPGSRMYRTGDKVVQLHDGSLKFLGRLDDQIKIRGHRIELGDVEAALQALPEVTCATAVPDGERLLAFMVAQPSFDKVAAREALRLILPEAMVPDQFVFVPDLPLNVHGKIDRPALAALVPAGLDATDREMGEVDEITRIWAEELGVVQITPDCDFFEIGGHSLAAARVIQRINLAFSTDITVRELFDLRTLGALRARLGYLRPRAERATEGFI